MPPSTQHCQPVIMSSPRVVLITGANQGLGHAILQIAGLRKSSYTYILGSRDLKNGREALKKLRGLGVKADIKVLELDVTNDDNVRSAVDFVGTTYGKLDILVNNAGIIQRPPEDDLARIRQTYNHILNVNITSVAVLTIAFTPLLYKSSDPKVINISSGLGSIHNSLTKKMGRSPPYGASKIGLNGLTVHMQVAENDRIEAEAKDGQKTGKPRIRYFVCAPGALKTRFTNFYQLGRSPQDGAEVVVQLLADEKHTYEGGSYWEYEAGEMREVPW